MAEQPGQSKWRWPTEETNRVCSWLEASCCQALVLGLFHFSVCCRYSTEGHIHSWRSLESTDGSFLTHAIEEPKRRGALLDLILTRKEGVVGKVKNQREPGLRWPWDGGAEEPEGGAKDKLTPLGFSRADLGLFKYLWGTVQQGNSLS